MTQSLVTAAVPFDAAKADAVDALLETFIPPLRNSDGAIRFARQAQLKFAEPGVRGHALGRAHAIVSELMIALDHEKGGEIAARLESLYRYVLDGLISANAKGDARALDSAIGVLETLAEGWHEIARSGAGEVAR